MSGNTKQDGFTLVEIMIATAVATILVGTLLTVTFLFYGGTIQTSTQARLAVESQNVLRSVVEELRVSSGVRAANTNPDPSNPGGWTTSNASLVLIIATPVLDTGNDYVINPATGAPYQNEIIYYAVDGILYKRYLAAPAPDNQFKTSCAPDTATETCPSDVILSSYFQTMNFIFYDQDDIVTTDLASARSTYITIEMEQRAFGRSVDFTNNIRMTMRNSL